MKSSARSSATAPSPLTQRAIKAFGFLNFSHKTLGVAVSGGSDSMALLVLAHAWGRHSGKSCRAVTVDHGLRPEAAQEARVVARVCGELGIPHETLKWRRAPSDEGGAGSVSQEDARRARHRLLARWAEMHDVDTLALGHTRDDRLETFLMRARQGSGWYGLAGPMPDGFSPVWPEGRRLPLIRPLLAFGREELREELRARGVSWIEDPTNDASKYERVRMRKLIVRMDPKAKTKALRVMDQLASVRAAVMAEAEGLLRHVHHTENDREVDVPLEARNLVGAEAWLRFVEAHVMAAGGSERPPRRDALDRLLARIVARDAELARGVTLAGAKVRIRDGAFLCFSQAPPRRGATRLRRDWGRTGTLLHAPDLRSLSV